jgi:hypothetical protein
MAINAIAHIQSIMAGEKSYPGKCDTCEIFVGTTCAATIIVMGFVTIRGMGRLSIRSAKLMYKKYSE